MQQMAAIDELCNKILRDAQWVLHPPFLSRSSLISLLMFHNLHIISGFFCFVFFFEFIITLGIHLQYSYTT